MFRIENVSLALCRTLLERGYNYLVVKYKRNNLDDDDETSPMSTITFEATRRQPSHDTISIQQFMKLPESSISRFYVMHSTSGETTLA